MNFKKIHRFFVLVEVPPGGMIVCPVKFLLLNDKYFRVNITIAEVGLKNRAYVCVTVHYLNSSFYITRNRISPSIKNLCRISTDPLFVKLYQLNGYRKSAIKKRHIFNLISSQLFFFLCRKNAITFSCDLKRENSFFRMIFTAKQKHVTGLIQRSFF